MGKTRRTTVTLELREVTIVHSLEPVTQSCPDCRPPVGLMMSPDAAAALSRRSPREVFQHIESGLIHFWESDQGRVLVCMRSLMDRVRELETDHKACK